MNDEITNQTDLALHQKVFWVAVGVVGAIIPNIIAQIIYEHIIMKNVNNKKRK